MGYGVIGNTTDSDSVIPGSSPGILAKTRAFGGKRNTRLIQN